MIKFFTIAIFLLQMWRLSYKRLDAAVLERHLLFVYFIIFHKK